jgi:hypothetical protein
MPADHEQQNSASFRAGDFAGGLNNGVDALVSHLM